jgi:MATE family multidrug resistance protein
MDLLRTRSNRQDQAVILKHGLTVWLGQMAVMAFSVVDSLVAGRHSNTSLAVLSLGAAIYISIYVALVGVVQSQLSLFAELYAAKKRRALRRHAIHAFGISIVLCVIGLVGMLHPEPLMHWAQVPVHLREELTSFLKILAWSLPAALAFRLFGTLAQARGQPRLVTRLQMAGLITKIPLTIWWVHGGWGMPEAGVMGCAWATWTVHWLMLTLALGWHVMNRPAAALRWRSLDWHPNAAIATRMLVLGVPAGLAVLAEVTSFTLIALFVARLGTQSSAAHQIASNVTAVLYMLPLSLAIATSARVGQHMGAQNAAQAASAALSGLRIQMPLSLVASLLLWGMSPVLVTLYSPDPTVQSLASRLLVWVALYHFFDGIQVMCAFILRSYRITFVPFLVYGICLWGLGLLGGHLLCFEGLAGLHAWQHVQAFWAMATAALVLAMLCLLALLNTALRWTILPKPTGAAAR